MPTVVLLGSLDTKGAEYEFLRDRLVEHGVTTLLIDTGVMGAATTTADISAADVAAEGGIDAGGAPGQARSRRRPRRDDRRRNERPAASACRGSCRRRHGARRDRRDLRGERRVPGAPAGRPEAHRVDGRLWRHGSLHRRERSHPRAQRHRRRGPQPPAANGDRQRRRGHGRDGLAPAAARDGRPEGHRRQHVRRHDALRDGGPAAPRRRRLRDAGLPYDRHGWPDARAAHPPRLGGRRPGRDDDRARGRARRRRVLGRVRSD